ncbi:hypothetical protein J2Y69_001163 [Microbacterium resistens]|uniref:DUF4192 family protein n=1 Tax=Microbacterium resistens TaxID=156977 RepID=A0ABU1SAD6_9MICO|nr:DUF4192 family protein [Microbacterium resistens]MDR6866570.1 hypothetical protein [Microbacterium resistens]
MTTILHASGAAELLSLIPVLAGFTPRRSVVLLPFADGRTGGALRFDAPPIDESPIDESPIGQDAVIETFAATAIGLACRIPATNAIAVALYLDEPLSDGDSLPGTRIAEELMLRARACGLRIVEVLCVGPDGWADYLDPAEPPRPLAELPAPPPVPGLVGIGDDQRSGSELPPADLVEKEAVAQALRALEHAMAGGPTDRDDALEGRVDPRAFAALLTLDDLPAFLEDALETPESRSPFLAAALIWVLTRPAFRDVALVQWACGIDAGAYALDAQLAFTGDPSSIPDELGDVILGRGPSPDPDRLHVALTLVRGVAALAPRPERPGALAAAAWLAWALGRSTHASRYIELAEAIDPRHSFIGLLRSVVDAGVLPDWAFRRG